MTVAIAIGSAAGVALVALLARALTMGGAVAATAIGTLILWATGWAGCAVLLTFFVSASAVGRVFGKQVATDAKGEQRDAWQVVANGGAAAVFAAIAHKAPPLALWIVTATLAAAAADTWATAFGSGSLSQPRHILTGRRVPPGTSGGITLRGTLGSTAGAFLVSSVGAIGSHRIGVVMAGTAIGVAGMLVDSVLGASIQGRFYCEACELASEWPVHRCGQPTRLTGGIAWITNDAVNGIATGLAGAAAWLLAPRLLP